MKYQYKYCSNCGNNFTKKTETEYECLKCNFRIFLNPKPAVGAIILNSENEILLIKRSYNPGKGKWGLPGGFISPGENTNKALKREIFEETGLTIKNFKYFGSFSGIYLYKKIKYITIDIIYTCNLKDNQNIKLSDEAKEFSFFEAKKIPLDSIAPNDAKLALTEFVKKN